MGVLLRVDGCVLDYPEDLGQEGSTLSRDYVLLRRDRKVFRYYITSTLIITEDEGAGERYPTKGRLEQNWSSILLLMIATIS